jgi:DedD protein
VAQSSPPVAPAIVEIPAIAVSEQPQPANQTVVQDKETLAASPAKIETPEKVQPVTAKAVEAKSADKPLNAETYTVQIGAYSNPDTAKQEWKKLKDRGFKAYTEKAGDKIRVRVGPYAEREKAEKVRLMLEKNGLHPNIVTLK